MNQKIILAFSGGLDTSFCIPYLIDQGYDVITATINTGGFNTTQLDEIANLSKQLGAINHYQVDACKELYEKYAGYIIKANYLKGGVYPACVGPERNIIASEIAKIAKQENTNCIAHGSTGAGNDQVRFDVTLYALLPDCKIITPIRDEQLTRAQEVEYLNSKGISINTEKKDYSINVGLFGTTIGGKETLGTKEELPDHAFPNVKPVSKVDIDPEEVKIEFKEGLPVSINGKILSGLEIIDFLNSISNQQGFGKDYHIGTTILGTKGRVGFEAPAMKILIKAHQELEKITLTSKQIFWKSTLGNLFGDLIHEGMYFDPIVEDLKAFLDSSNKYVSGFVTVRISQGQILVVSIDSENSLMNSKLGSYGETTGSWTGLEAKGFCKLYGLESINAFLTHQKND